MKPSKFKDLIIFENDNYIVVNKPPYMSALEDRDKTKGNLLELAKEYAGDVQLGHRLDKETSGALAIAKTPEAYRHLAIQFEKREVTKVYHAVVDGIQDLDGILIDRPLYISARGNVKIDPAGKPSQTLVKSLEIFQRHTLVACKPVTGRMHQIRVHLSYIDAPIVADELYGGKYPYLSQIKRKFKMKKDEDEQPLISRFALHSKELQFTDLDGSTIKVEADYPKDIRALLNQLKKNK